MLSRSVNNMKKVLHFSHTDIQSDSRILKEIESLIDAGYEVRGIGVSLKEGSKRGLVDFGSSIRTIQLTARALSFLPRTFRHVLTLFELIIKMLPLGLRFRPDVIHCHDTLVLPVGVIIKFFLRSKLIYDAHELESDRNGLTRFQGVLTLFIEKFLWRLVDALIVVSPSIENWYHLNIGKKNSAVILNSPIVDVGVVGEDNGDHRENYHYLHNRFNIPHDRKIFIYIGIFGAGRGLDFIVEAFTRSDVKSHVVFLGYGQWSERIQSLSKVYSNIHVHESVPHSNVVSIVKSADFGLCLVENVSLSDYYCLPNKLFEYCFGGVPVLASNFPDIRSVVQEFGLGACCNLEINDIHQSIIDLESKEFLFSFRDLSPLSWGAQRVKLLDLYDKVSHNI